MLRRPSRASGIEEWAAYPEDTPGLEMTLAGAGVEVVRARLPDARRGEVGSLAVCRGEMKHTQSPLSVSVALVATPSSRSTGLRLLGVEEALCAMREDGSFVIFDD